MEKSLLEKSKKTVNILGQDITLKELYQIPLALFKVVFEFASYAYKAVARLAEAVGLKAFKTAKPEADALNGAKEFILDYQRQAQRFKNKPAQKFLDFYKEHLDKNALMALDREGNSKIDNRKMGRLTQLLGTVMSIYFATTDDFNRTAKRTRNKEQAECDARERGVNKAFRIVTQIVMMDIFNNTFKIPYAQSLVGAFGVTTACTLLTDVISRELSGRPSHQVKSKEEFEQYKKAHKKGALKGYYKMIDKLAQ